MTRRPILKATLILLTLAALGLCARQGFYSIEHDSAESACRVSCSSNLRQLGNEIELYAKAHRGAYPPSLDAIAQEESIDAKTFVCPSAARRRDNSLAALVGLAGPLPASYVYLGDGLTTQTTPDDAIVALERADNHPDGGMNLLFGDGHVEYLSVRRLPEWTRIEADIARHARPVRLHPVTPTQR